MLVCLAVFLVLHDVAAKQHTRPDLGQHSNNHKQDKADAQVMLGFVGAPSSMAIMFQHGCVRQVHAHWFVEQQGGCTDKPIGCTTTY